MRKMENKDGHVELDALIHNLRGVRLGGDETKDKIQLQWH